MPNRDISDLRLERNHNPKVSNHPRGSGYLKNGRVSYSSPEVDQLSHTEAIYRVLYGKPDESTLARIIRRFPIKSHKPGR